MYLDTDNYHVFYKITINKFTAYTKTDTGNNNPRLRGAYRYYIPIQRR